MSVGEEEVVVKKRVRCPAGPAHLGCWGGRDESLWVVVMRIGDMEKV